MKDSPNRKVDFSACEWEDSDPGIRFKSFERNGKRMRLLELGKGLDHPHWCETGHVGFVVEGEIEIAFGDKSTRYSEGDGLFILSGEGEKHIPKPISETVILFLVEDI